MRAILALIVAGAFLSACGELPQDGIKPFAGEKEQTTDAGKLTKRTDFQNEYLRTGGEKK